MNKKERKLCKFCGGLIDEPNINGTVLNMFEEGRSIYRTCLDNRIRSIDLCNRCYTLMQSYRQTLPKEERDYLERSTTPVDSTDIVLCGNAGENVHLTFKGGCREELNIKDAYRCTGCGGWFHKACLYKHFELEKEHDYGRQQEREALKITGETSDGYHTFNELYEFRKLYNACLFNEWSARGLYKVHKSKKHSDGEDCFGGDWFIVTATLPTGQISNHYELKDWDLFQCEEREKADVWDGHTPQDVAKRLETLAKLPIQNSRNLLERLKMKTWKDKKDSLPPHIGLIARVRKEVVEGTNVIEAFEDGYDQAVKEINSKLDEFIESEKI